MVGFPAAKSVNPANDIGICLSAKRHQRLAPLPSSATKTLNSCKADCHW